MFIKLSDSNKIHEFINIFDLLKNFNQHITLQFTDKGLFCQSMDSSHVSLYDLTIDKEWFSEYRLINDTIISLVIYDFVKILSANKNYNCLTLSHTIDEDIYLNIDFENFKVVTVTDDVNSEKKVRKRVKKAVVDSEVDEITDKIKEMNINKTEITESIRYEVPLIEIECEQLGIPDTVYNMRVSINTKKFIEYLNKLSIFEADNFEIIGSKKDKQVNLNSTSSNGNKVSMVISNDIFNSFKIREDIKVLLSYKYIKMCVNDKITDNIELNINDNEPININYLFDNNLIIFKYFVSPKIDEE